ncbi:MAG: hypothetical protein AABY44_09430 [Nitrospirota bacterium]
MKIMDLLKKALFVTVVFSFSLLFINADAQAAQLRGGSSTTSDPQKKSTSTPAPSPTTAPSATTPTTTPSSTATPSPATPTLPPAEIKPSVTIPVQRTPEIPITPTYRPPTTNTGQDITPPSFFDVIIPLDSKPGPENPAVIRGFNPQPEPPAPIKPGPSSIDEAIDKEMLGPQGVSIIDDNKPSEPPPDDDKPGGPDSVK